MIASNPFILYTLPKSRTTQALRQKKIEAAWESIKVFLTSCTDADPLHPQGNSLTAYEPYHTDKDPERARKTIIQLKDLFGLGETAPIAVGYPDETKWDIIPDQFSKALNYLIAGQPWPPAAFGPVELLLTYDITFIDPNTRAVLPDQENRSFILFWLGRSNKCTMNFWFPFQTPGVDFWTYLKKIEPYLPFMIEEKYLKTGRPNKDRTRHIFSKILK
jgi:hypothetical protein